MMTLTRSRSAFAKRCTKSLSAVRTASGSMSAAGTLTSRRDGERAREGERARSGEAWRDVGVESGRVLSKPAEHR